jgi:hypothetical protein
VFRKSIAKPERYVWQQPDYNEDDDPFLKHFDDDGNFIEFKAPKVEEEHTFQDRTPNITYVFKENKED